MESAILDGLEDVGYEGSLCDPAELNIALSLGAKSVELTSLLSWLCGQLAALCGIDEAVHPTTTTEECVGFLVELSSFLKAVGCPNRRLQEGPVNERLKDARRCAELLEYLLSELQAVRMLSLNRPQAINPKLKVAKMDSASVESGYLKRILLSLSFPKPPANVTPLDLWTKVYAKVKELVSSVPAGVLGQPLLSASLSEKQWSTLVSVNSHLSEEYRLRREMLLKRLDVTIQSFSWSDRLKDREDQMAQVYRPLRAELHAKPSVELAHLLAARNDLLHMEKTSSASVRTQSAIQRLIIPKVPDRGGRTSELQAPPPEMPAFRQRQSAPQQQRQGSARVQGGWAPDANGSNRGHRDQRGGGRGGGRGRRQ